jgi:sec-independent protein translocase protein TatB
MFNLGAPEMVFILLLALLIFGPKRLPQLGRTLGKAMGEFRRATTELQRSINLDIEESDRTAERESGRLAATKTGHAAGVEVAAPEPGVADSIPPETPGLQPGAATGSSASRSDAGASAKMVSGTVSRTAPRAEPDATTSRGEAEIEGPEAPDDEAPDDDAGDSEPATRSSSP